MNILLQGQSPVPEQVPYALWLLGTVLITAISTLITYLSVRKKNAAEIDHKYQQMVLELSDSLGEWIEKFTELNNKLIVSANETAQLKQEVIALQQRIDNHVAKESEYRDLLNEARGVLDKLETSLEELAEHAPLIDELAQVRAKLLRVTQAQPLTG